MALTKNGAAKLTVILVSLLVVIKVVASIVTGSISIRADAIHSSIDLVAAVIAFIGIKVSGKPADEQHPFGHGKAENIAGVVVGVLTLVAAGTIGYEAITRLLTEAAIELVPVGILVTGGAIAINSLTTWILLRISRRTESLALRAQAGHLFSDVLSSVAVLIGLVAVQLTGLTILDPIVALIVTLLILKVGYEILKVSLGGLLDTRLPETEEVAIKACLQEHNTRLVSFHGLRTRKAGNQRFIEFHLVMPRTTSVDEVHDMCDHLEDDIAIRLKYSSVTIHVEPCSNECHICLVTCELRQANA